MTRFFVKPQDIFDFAIKLSAEDLDHIRSLRLRPDEQFVVCDGDGFDYICRLGKSRHGGGITAGTEANTATAHGFAEIVDKRPSHGEPTVMCSVYLAYAKGDRLDYAVQKSVELGAGDITLFASERCVSTPRDTAKKIVRLQRIALETAKQCGRGCIPKVAAANSFCDAIALAARAGLPLFFYECEDKQHLKQVLGQRCDIETVSIVTGPEGGFEPHEAEAAKAAGMIAVTLGPRILRCETAPAAALAALMFHTDNF